MRNPNCQCRAKKGASHEKAGTQRTTTTGKMAVPKDNKPLDVKAWTIHDLWAKYEDIAMHFNDLLIRLRSQALAGVAALSALIGIFTRTEPTGFQISWQIATDVFILLILFWIAIWAIDRLYYNRLLIGAVIALLAIEEESKKANPNLAINLSTQIEKFVANPFSDDPRSCWERFHSKLGVRLFYFIVLFALIGGALYCFRQE